jgi:D-amino-acid dehydrogenase
VLAAITKHDFIIFFYPNLEITQQEIDLARGMRPVSPDGLPFIGGTNYENLTLLQGL